MKLIKHIFTITDLENISGIKAHTIRIWEKRYHLFQPERVARNIRQYNIKQLQKLLNISILYERGWKISKIASLSEEEIIFHTKRFVTQNLKIECTNKDMKLAMYKFDSALFERHYQEAIKKLSFSEVYQEIFAPILHFTGLLWQTHSINPAHEHFISNLIMQKIILHTSLLKENKPAPDKPTFVLHLPEEEMHEISLLYLNYELKLRGYYTIYIGRSISLKDLKRVGLFFPSIIWVGIFTMNPSPKLISSYIEDIQPLLENKMHEYWTVGKNLNDLPKINDSIQFKTFPSVKELLTHLNLETDIS